jgi:hypothetical protein
MTKTHSQHLMRTACASAVATLLAAPAWATDFEIGNDWTGSWNSSLSLGSSWRAHDRDPRLYGKANGSVIGLTNGTGANTIDEGNLNYEKGDRFTTLFKLFSEVEVKKGDMGALIRAKAWYDQALNDKAVRFGSQNNGYTRTPLSDAGFEKLNRFKGVYLLDAYVYNTFEVAGQPLQVRAGNLVVNWGESLFIQGINQINPIDVPSFRKPGAQLKEVFLPVPILHASQSLGAWGGVEVFWQAKWKNTPIEAGCGNYWGVVNANISTDTGPCNNEVTLTGGSATGVAANAYVPQVQGREAKDSGQFGIAYRFTSDALDTEFGIYAMKLHSRTPVLSLVQNTTTVQSPFAAIWGYPENIKTYGFSASTNVLGWSLAGEISHSRGVPVQVDGNDLLLAGLGATGALGAPVPYGPFGKSALAQWSSTGEIAGFSRANKTQLQINTVKAGNGILGAGQYLFVAEVGFQFNNLPDYKEDPTAVRYGRPFIFGPGSHPLYGGSTCASGQNINIQGCDNDGYVSRRSWGYRLKGELTYNDLIPGVAVYPSVYWSHDVHGYSLDNQFSKGRQTLGLAARFSYAKKYSLEVGGVRYNHNAKYDPLRDRDSVYVNASMSF